MHTEADLRRRRGDYGFDGDFRRDMTSLPFEEQSFDVIVSGIAMHNIPNAAGRQAAIDEAVRVLRPGGRIVIADLLYTRKHLAPLRSLGLTETARRNLGWRVWWGGPYFPTPPGHGQIGSALMIPLDRGPALRCEHGFR